MSRSTNLRVGLASKGSYEDATKRFLSDAGLSIWRPNPRQYVGRISTVDGADVLFQRPEDIVHKVADGSLDLGITGYDLVAEHANDEPEVHVVIPDLGFRRCELVLAVPDAWLDISGINDLADLSIKFKRQGRTLRVATKFTNLVSDYFFRHGVNYFELIAAHGALEAAPSLGYADVIADLSETGVTLRDNHLRVIDGGVVLRAQACLIGNLATIAESPYRLEQARKIIELCEAKLAARRFRVVTANVSGESPDSVAEHIIGNLDVAGERGPTVSPVFPKDPRAGHWFSVSVIVHEDRMLAAVDHLRSAGSTGITVSTPDYMFANRSEAFATMRAAITTATQEVRR